MSTLDLRAGSERHIPASDQYPGFFGIMLGDGREIAAIGEGAEEAVREAIIARSQPSEQVI